MKISEIFQKLKFGDKKVVEISVAVIFLGIFLLVSADGIFRSKPAQKEEIKMKESEASKERDALEEKISRILSGINGAGKVEVVITYEAGVEKVYAFETRTNESSDKGGDSREADNEERLAYEEDSDGTKRPVLKKEIEAIPKGAVVLAQGADNPLVNKLLQEAVSVLLKLPAYKIQVLKGDLP